MAPIPAAEGIIMTRHVAVPTRYVHERYFGRPSCPKCGNLMIAPESSERLNGYYIRFKFFLLRMAFWLGVVLVLLPSGASQRSASTNEVGASDALSAASAAVSDLNGDPQLGLLSSAPMVPQAAEYTAVPDEAAPWSPPDAAPRLRPVPTATPPTSPAKPTAAPSHRRAERPGSVLNDAQIASIKERLHLTPDQEAMWPAVEAALRNVAYARVRDAHRRGAPASAAQLASADPDSVEVQGLKSAAIPLLMSFNAEQKNEVRSLAHVMGLDKLASEL